MNAQKCQASTCLHTLLDKRSGFRALFQPQFPGTRYMPSPRRRTYPNPGASSCHHSRAERPPTSNLELNPPPNRDEPPTHNPRTPSIRLAAGSVRSPPRAHAELTLTSPPSQRQIRTQWLASACPTPAPSTASWPPAWARPCGSGYVRGSFEQTDRSHWNRPADARHSL
jgi:hypothetical protein